MRVCPLPLIVHSCGTNSLYIVLLYTCIVLGPDHRGTFIEFRNGLINLCPVGRNCTQAEREEFAEYDKVSLVRW